MVVFTYNVAVFLYGEFANNSGIVVTRQSSLQNLLNLPFIDSNFAVE